MSKIDDVRSAMTEALKGGEKEKKEALSMLLAALKQKQIDKREDLTLEEENAVVLREIKQAQETIDTAPADRKDIIKEAQFRIEVMQEFAPEMMDEKEIRKILTEILSELVIEHPTMQDKGKVMRALMPHVKGKADGALVNKVVEAFLNSSK